MLDYPVDAASILAIYRFFSQSIHLSSNYLSNLFRDVLDYPLDAAGILAAFPYILMAIVVQVQGVH